MRNLTAEEIKQALDDNGESENGAVAIEATVKELADIETETACGKYGNKTFKALVDKGYEHRKCRGWFIDKSKLEMCGEKDRNAPMVLGMFHIKIQTDKTAEKVEKIASDAGGSLRFNGDSLWEGYKEFENE
jgi:hypothetical protein